MFGVVTFYYHMGGLGLFSPTFLLRFLGWLGWVRSVVWVWAYHIMDGLGLGLKDCIP